MNKDITIHVYQRKSGNKNWVARVDNLPPDPLTGEKQKPKFFTSSLEGRKGKMDVTTRADEFVKKIKDGDLSCLDNLTVGGWLDKYIEVYCTKLAQTTLEGYKRYIENHIKPEIGNIKMSQLIPMQIENFYNKERAKGYSEKTILQEHRILHKAFKKAVGDNKLLKNPCDGVDAPSPEEYEPTIYTEEQYSELLDKLRGNRIETVILLAGMCGLRRGELMALRWEDLDLDNGIIYVTRNRVPTTEKGVIEKDPKSKKSKREFSIPSIIIPELKRLRGIGKIFTKLNGEAGHPSNISKYFKEFLEKNGLPHMRLHDLRHFNGTMMLKHGVSEKEIMERGGWSTAAMVKKYQHVLKEMDRKSANKLNNVLKRKRKNGVKTSVSE